MKLTLVGAAALVFCRAFLVDPNLTDLKPLRPQPGSLQRHVRQSMHVPGGTLRPRPAEPGPARR